MRAQWMRERERDVKLCRGTGSTHTFTDRTARRKEILVSSSKISKIKKIIKQEEVLKK